ncbi:MAG TPA: hypothetical protein VND19_25770 [Acetobacteraceae bacterium]|nr:hypothetical protein [Acetobacteraceae bacterium]
MRGVAVAGILAAAGLATMTARAHAGVVAAAAYAYDLNVNLTITQPLLPTVTVAFGPVNLVTASGPSSSSSSTIPVFGPLAHLIHRISRSRIDSEQAMEPGAPHPRQGDPHFSPYLSGARG